MYLPNSFGQSPWHNSLEVSQFKFQLHFYFHFRTDNFGKDIEPTYPPSYELKNTTTVF